MRELASSILKSVLPSVLALGCVAPRAEEEAGRECPDPLNIWHAPPIQTADGIPIDGVLDVLGVCGETLVLCWGRPGDDEAPDARAIEGGRQTPSMLLGIDRNTGAILWRREAGFGSSGILWTEGDRFWHLQQSCEVSIFLVKRRTADGSSVLSVDFTSLPPLDYGVQDTSASDLYATFAKEVGPCELDRHRHGKDLPGLTLEEAFRKDGTIWFFISLSIPEFAFRRQRYLCAASPFHKVWAWYSLAGNSFELSRLLRRGFGRSEEDEEDAELPKEGRDDIWPAGLPEAAFERECLRDVDGRMYWITACEVLRTFEDPDSLPEAGVSVMPIDGGTFRKSEGWFFTLTPHPRLGGEEKEWDWSQLVWSPYIVIVWHSGRKLLIDLHSIREDLAGRVGPFSVVEDEIRTDRLGLSCDEDEAVVGIGSRLVALTRKRHSENGKLDLRARPLRTPFLQEQGRWDVALKALMESAGRVYATFHLVRQKEKGWEDRWLAAGWRAGEEAPAWSQEIE